MQIARSHIRAVPMVETNTASIAQDSAIETTLHNGSVFEQ
jgi:hypothetical protein